MYFNAVDRSLFRDSISTEVLDEREAAVGYVSLLADTITVVVLHWKEAGIPEDQACQIAINYIRDAMPVLEASRLPNESLKIIRAARTENELDEAAEFLKSIVPFRQACKNADFRCWRGEQGFLGTGSKDVKHAVTGLLGGFESIAEIQ